MLELKRLQKVVAKAFLDNRHEAVSEFAFVDSVRWRVHAAETVKACYRALADDECSLETAC